jgi:hypothetical protein
MYEVAARAGARRAMGPDRVVWRKASRSYDDGDQYVEIAAAFDVVLLRDSKDPNGPKLILSRRNFGRLVGTVKNA